MNTPRSPLGRVGGGTLSVRFLRVWQSYMPGDVATFPAHIAQGLVARRAAEAVNIAAAGQSPPDGETWPWALRPPGQITKES